MRGRMPEIVRTRLEKFGFPTSAEQFLQTALRERCRDLIGTRAVRDAGFLNVPEIDRQLNAERTDATFSKRLFHITQLAMWHNLSRLCVTISVFLGGLRDVPAALT
jgi:asparagine synthase (glutamine-hydrolysing)